MNSQTGIGIDCMQPIDINTGEINANATVDIVANTCTQWVRLNFILGPWSSPEDQTLHNGKTWKQTYDEIVDGFEKQGIEIYGVIGSECNGDPNDILREYPGINTTDADNWIQQYTINFVKVVDYFKDRIRVYESYNEPNDWQGGTMQKVHPHWFAKILQDVYLNTKYFNNHGGDQSWQVTLVSGPLFTSDIGNGGDGGQYINDTYYEGINNLAWSWIHQQTGSYPLDGLGMHIYAEQGSSDASTITSAINANIDGFWNNVTNYEGNTSKKIWLSEIGWQSNLVGNSGQADNLTTSFNILKNDSRIALAIWFCLMDFPGNYWGIYEQGNFTSSDQKNSFNAFKNQVNCYATKLQVAPDCSGNVNFNWTNTDNGWWIDISPDPNFSFYYHKDISNVTSTSGPSNFQCDNGFAPCTPSSLSFSPGTTYYWRIFNGYIHSEGSSFTLPALLLAPTITTSSGITTCCQGESLTLDAGAGYSTYTWSNGATNQTINVSSSGNYSLVVSNDNGCFANSNTIWITVNPLPATPQITQNGNVLNSSATTGNQWYLNGNIIIDGIFQSYTFTQIGNYSLTVTDLNSCSASSSDFNVITTEIKTSALADGLEDEIIIYPNPNNGFFSLKFNYLDKDLAFNIFNVFGEKIYSKNMLDIQSGKLDIALPSGIYFIKILKEGEMYYKKIVCNE